MAATTITNGVVTLNASTAMPTAGTVAAGEGVVVNYDKASDRVLLRIQNSNTSATHTAVIVKGNALQGVADMEITLAASADVVAVVETGRFKTIS